MLTLHPEVTFQPSTCVLIAGPCSVESYEQTYAVAQEVKRLGLHVLRGGAFKPRTSPHTFQGLGLKGLEILRAVADEFGLLVVTEALGVEHVPLVAQYADILQIGSRNMQHFPLLWAAAESGKPILLKRGFMSTLDEWFAAAEHLRVHGNERIILCERGIRSFDPSTRNLLDVTAIPLAHQRTPYPVIADPSHATGHADLVLPASLAALAAGADGLIVEVHPRPAEALSDGAQSLALADLPVYVEQVRRLAKTLGREVI